MIGRQLASYRIVEEIGSGGMGIVYRAEDLRLGRDVAIKVLPDEFASDEDHLERFRREARLLAALDHPSIVTVHSIEEADDAVFLTMQLVRGESLDKCIPKHGMPPERVVEIGLQVAEALVVAHKAGIIHRDIKPSNIMVGDDERVKILDFGLAKVLPSEAAPVESEVDTQVLSPTITHPGAIPGTLAYMAPEQLSGGPGDPRCDIYSLGAVIFELATGRRLFRGASRSESRSASRIRPELPRRLDEILDRCLRPDPAERWSSAAELRRELGQLAPGRSQDPRGAHVASVAIMPLSDRSSGVISETEVDPSWFADGLTEALVTGLARLGSLRVIASTSTMSYKDRQPSAAQVGHELGVDYLLSGSVVRTANRIRVGVQLVDTSNESVVWAEDSTHEVEDILSVQGDVARAVAHQIDLQLSPEERLRVEGKVRVGKKGLKAYLIGRHLWGKRFQGGLRMAIDHFKQALDEEPDYAPAYSGLADCHIVLGWYAFVPPQAAFEEARKAATRALEIDPLSPEALTSLAGVTHLYDWNWERSESLFKRAIELNPNYAHCRWWYAFLLMTHGRPEESLEQTRVALDRDPTSPYIKATAGWMRFLAGRNAQAEALLRETLEVEESFDLTYIFLTWNHERLERYDEAERCCRRALERLKMQSLYLQLAHTLAVSGQVERAWEQLEAVEAVRGEQWVSPCQLAVVYLALGERSRALELIQEGFEVRDPWVLTLGVDYRYDALREDSTFRELVEHVVSGGAAR